MGCTHRRRRPPQSWAHTALTVKRSVPPTTHKTCGGRGRSNQPLEHRCHGTRTERPLGGPGVCFLQASPCATRPAGRAYCSARAARTPAIGEASRPLLGRTPTKARAWARWVRFGATFLSSSRGSTWVRGRQNGRLTVHPIRQSRMLTPLSRVPLIRPAGWLRRAPGWRLWLLGGHR